MLGVDVGGTKTLVVLLDKEGNIVEEHRFPTIKDPEKLVQKVHEAAKSYPLQSIGAGIAGQVDGKIARFVPNLGWRDVPFGSLLEEKFNVPVSLVNDVRAATYAEWKKGAAVNCQDFICIFVGTGVGGGIVSGGRLLTGATNTAGELGHMRIEIDGRPCTCGGRGCLEAYAGGWAIAKFGEEEVEPALQAGAVALVNLLNPSLLIFGGGVVDGRPYLVESIKAAVEKGCLEAALPVEVMLAKTGDQAVAIGAAISQLL